MARPFVSTGKKWVSFDPPAGLRARPGTSPQLSERISPESVGMDIFRSSCALDVFPQWFLSSFLDAMPLKDQETGVAAEALSIRFLPRSYGPGE